MTRARYESRSRARISRGFARDKRQRRLDSFFLFFLLLLLLLVLIAALTGALGSFNGFNCWWKGAKFCECELWNNKNGIVGNYLEKLGRVDCCQEVKLCARK